MNIAVLGFGTVGKGVVEIVDGSESDCSIKTIFAREKYRNEIGDRLETNFDNILQDESIAIIVEVLGGETFAYDCIKRALNAHKHVVTANKNIISKHFIELTSLAKENHVALHYEASVGGGIPVIQTLIKSSATDQVYAISGVVNGTANYILTQMTQQGKTLEDALTEARESGFAEADATADLEGFDAARKLSILGTIAFKQPISYDDIQTRGINGVTPAIIEKVTSKGYHLKHAAVAKYVGNQMNLRCEPVLVKASHPFFHVENETNSISFQSTYNDTVTLIGLGAGSLPTASAIVSDIYLITRGQYYDAIVEPTVIDKISNIPTGEYFIVTEEEMVIKPASQVELDQSQFYASVVE
ncbi:MAG: homoserine dehydrogenase [Bavariicoccus seileri]|uniref:homoserine dehydrogenase n=1 Tax=Bavariicoccus seileri TaxID=549685 RepID=UPI0003B40DD1|nr:homoserine dehydrogenase [Bavariicoccus seileri]